MSRIASRRALLQVGAPLGFVAASGLALPALARDTKKTGAEETAFPPEQLMRSHAVLARVLLIYEAGMRRMGQGEDIDPAVYSEAAEITNAFIHDHQDKMEEELVFTRFKTGGRMVELVGVLANQHQAGRKLTERILAAAPQARNRKSRGYGAGHPGPDRHVSPAHGARGDRPIPRLAPPRDRRRIR